MAVKSDTGPFAIVPEWVLDLDITPQAVRLYCLLARYADASGRSFPSRATLAKRLKVKDRKVVDRAARELEAAGALTIVRRASTTEDPTDASTNVWMIHRLHRALPPEPHPSGSEAPPPSGSDAAQNENHHEREEPPPAAVAPGSAKSKKDRPRDPIFDALAAVFPAVTRSEQSRTAKVAHELRALKPPPAPEIVERAARWVRNEWPNATVMAVGTNWTQALNSSRRAGPGSARPVMQRCTACRELPPDCQCEGGPRT